MAPERECCVADGCRKVERVCARGRENDGLMRDAQVWMRKTDDDDDNVARPGERQVGRGFVTKKRAAVVLLCAGSTCCYCCCCCASQTTGEKQKWK